MNEDLFGTYNIYKPVGMSSHDVVYKVRKITGIKKVGHAGTLDPLAEGVLVVCVGRKYTKNISNIVSTEKEYEFGLTLGVVTETYDKEGKVLSEKKVTNFDENILNKLINEKYTGAILQTPPMFSAVHHKGKRLYELARKGIEVKREPREINIKKFELLGITGDDNPELKMKVACGTGTYVRALANDIGADLGYGGYASYIKRTKVGDFLVEDSLTLEEFENVCSEKRN